MLKIPGIGKPRQSVVETDEKLTIDGFSIEFVVDESVKTKQLSKECVEVTVTFLAKSYEFKK